jgi:2-keto-4-pentenoate hydratase
VPVRKGKRLDSIHAAALWLEDQHARGAPFAPLPAELAPHDLAEAYAVQDAFVSLQSRRKGAIIGYKVALSTAAMRAFAGVDSPMAGCVLASTVRESPARVRAGDFVRLIVEFEIAVKMGDDLPVAGAPYSRERVAQAVGAIMPALELADDRGADYSALAKHPLELAADNTWNEGAVFGAPVAQWHSLDLARIRGVARINGEVVGEGVGAEAMGHPLEAVAWVANHLASLGRGLLRGDVVLTGSLVTSKFPRPGDRVAFDLDGLGAAEALVE